MKKCMKRIASILLVVFLLAALALTASAASVPDEVLDVRNSVVRLKVENLVYVDSFGRKHDQPLSKAYDENGNEVWNTLGIGSVGDSVGTGFLIGTDDKNLDTIITCAHMTVGEYGKVLIEDENGNQVYDSNGRVEPSKFSVIIGRDYVVPCEVLGSSAEGEFAILKLTEGKRFANRTSAVLHTLEGVEEPVQVLLDGEYSDTTYVKIENGQKITGMSITAKDAAENITREVNVEDAADTSFSYDDEAGANVYDSLPVEVDMTAPVLTLVKTVEESKAFINTVGDVDYYNGEVTYTVKAEDKNLASAQLTYTIDGETTTVVLANGTEASFKVTDGQTLTAMTLTALDNAQWPATVIADENQAVRTDFTYDEDTQVHSYNANPIVVDKTAPVVEVVKTVEKDKKYIQTVDGVDYYNGKVTYTINVTDDFLTKAEFITVAAKYQQEDTPVTVQMTGENGEYTGSITVVDDKVLEGITIQVLDNAQNPATVIADGNQTARTDFTYDEYTQVHSYNGNFVAVDTIAPTVEIGFSENVIGVYTNENTPGVVYVKLDPAVVDENAKKAEATLTITASDKNLTSTKGILKVAAGEGDNGVDTEVFDEESGKFKVVYTQKAEVAADKLGAIAFALTVTDMAGNSLLPEGVSYKDMTDGSVVPDGKLPVNANGCISGTIAIDRRRPTSTTEDNAAPQITITPSVKSVGKVTNT